MEQFKLYRPVRPKLNYPNNNYGFDKNKIPPSVLGQRFGENKACRSPDGRIFGTWEPQCPVGSTSVYAEYGLLGHNGLDIPCKGGEPIYAAHDGSISRIEADSRGGWGVRVLTSENYPYKSAWCRFETLYWHIFPNPPVKEGQLIKVGDLIAFADNTGDSSGPHLHLGLKPKTYDGLENLELQNGYRGAINPLDFLVEEDAVNFQKLRILQRIAELYRQILVLWFKK
jgi:murein DD-endopeptidase MepM/ murein hydrolase activator NlpD